jgi:hypothetical protein
MQWYTTGTPAEDIRFGLPNGFQEWHQPIKRVGRAWHEYPTWAEKFKKEFDPIGMANPPVPFQADELVVRHPNWATSEIEETTDLVNKIAREGK